ncbi:unnamed protein product [Phaeothamnion confervicola]
MTRARALAAATLFCGACVNVPTVAWLAAGPVRGRGRRLWREVVAPGIHKATRRAALHMSSAKEQDAAPGSAGPMILGSKSFTRRLILEEMGYTPIVRTADIDERAVGDRESDPFALVLALGLAKADALLPRLQAERIAEERRGDGDNGNGGGSSGSSGSSSGLGGAQILLTGDQVVVHDGRVIEKPADFAEVRRNIRAYAVTPPRTVGSVVLTDLVSGCRVSGSDAATIHFAPIPEPVVEQLIASAGDILLCCAGGLMAEHPLVTPYLEQIDGTMDSVLGLSKPLVRRLMAELAAASALGGADDTGGSEEAGVVVGLEARAAGGPEKAAASVTGSG